MKCLMDSSAIILVLKWLKEKSVEALNGHATLNLAYYEINNVIWKQCAIGGSINLQEAINRAKEAAQILEIMSMEELRSAEDVGETMKYAVEQRLTFYDASYLQKAKSKDYVLVTEDKELSEKSGNVGVKAITVKEYLNLIKL
ncbi:MAG: type II toxin-antitoxin system VapC family toxin [Nitrososphaerota archaeon]|nr:type II toxin-antitoxin system VapC family toxin [Candidatus Bathyarchaeota archaeon]MDW8049310.1 type II toxin-antitoxin system VapC family toxin [Nitrososphaerota archaeon]